ncbi:MAG: hypothetical protein V1681_06360 [Candidatus Neomarinimicrobiota bacterium]
MKTKHFPAFYHLFLIGLLSLLLTGLIGCSRNYKLNKVPELIEFVHIPAGHSTPLSLDQIFTADKYKPTFRPNADLSWFINRIPAKSSLRRPNRLPG